MTDTLLSLVPVLLPGAMVSLFYSPLVAVPALVRLAAVRNGYMPLFHQTLIFVKGQFNETLI